MYVYTVWRSSQADPKSIILIMGLSRLLLVSRCSEHGKWNRDRLLEKDVLRLQIAVDQASFAKQTQTAQQLLSKDSHKSSAQSSELVLLDELV
jgi:hypothetical protein